MRKENEIIAILLFTNSSTDTCLYLFCDFKCCGHLCKGPS